jgi:pantoate--beta-alanine ligase
MRKAVSLSEVRRARTRLAEPVGLVPTMGYLHEGHLSLIRAAKKDCASVVVSIFVNPTQFAPTEDLLKYPRDLPRDLDMLAAEEIDLVWIPKVKSMYPPGFQTWVDVEKITLPLEGALRPGHFRGVTTIVAKLINAVQPQLAYFGQKDAQQALVIQRMVEDLNFNLKIIVCPTIREPDGLAMSSRNLYLDPTHRKSAVVLYQALVAAQKAFINGEKDAEHLRLLVRKVIEDEPFARVQYVSCSDPGTLKEIQGNIRGEALLSLAVLMGNIRLIDNLLLGERKDVAHN